MKALQTLRTWALQRDNQRDVLGVLGLTLLLVGLERIYSGAGMATCGAIMVSIAVLVH